MTERALNMQFLGAASAILTAMDIVSAVILAIMLLILGNTIAMSVRERTHEYGVLLAVGFRPRHIGGFIIGEGIAIGLLGGVCGLILAYPLVEKGLGRFLEENMGSYFPYFRVPLEVSVLALIICAVLGALAAGIPAYRASRLNAVEALRRLG
jgi:putative ABC transport system permease protein